MSDSDDLENLQCRPEGYDMGLASQKLLDTPFTPNDNPADRHRPLHHRLLPSVVHILLLAVGICLGVFCGSFLGLIRPQSPQQSLSRFQNSPAYGAVAAHPLETRPDMHVGPRNPYSGAPKPETDNAWAALLKGYNLRVPSSSLSQEHAPSIPLSDGSGNVWVSLGMYHHLHCLDSIRHQIHGRNCISQDSTTEADGFPKHLDHCIDTLRQWLMCQPDLSLRSVYWREDGLSAAANNSITHECVNWDALQEWVDQHSISAKDEAVQRPDGALFDGPEPPPPRCATKQS
ncbi:uncharacterized protein HMPREF1541_06339 [Cyphellophora europaea CBS 101466]|uniref:Oxidase ustYa n=1 Tax=Cyphellophora europaea (strain CBS 101466) TaxID=1220924 RepID=W2RRG0_CYPE1|nr:uncharacterized protein HMPREF1541_06339 [Cyphellophora europaea CBS 101466]ETN38308.1 hypothetical protein HMPREF1541_06339 [Cyphellophora europaea CBS 101466]